MNDLNLVLLGSMDQLADNAEALIAAGYRPRRALLPDDRDNSNVIARLQESGVESIIVKNINADPTPFAEVKPDIALCYAFPQIFKQHVISIPRLGLVNFHTSDLPAYRGRHPVNWAFINGETYIGVTAHFVSPGIDEGDIILRDRVSIDRNDDISSVLDKLGDKTTAMSVAVVRQLTSGSVHRMKQDPALASYQRKRTPEDGRINWATEAGQLHRLINGLAAPYPNAFCELPSGVVRVQRSYSGSRPGEIVARTDNGLYVVATLDGVILVAVDRELKVGDRLA
jgi:methionyl-tRNA formyltransferase